MKKNISIVALVFCAVSSVLAVNDSPLGIDECNDRGYTRLYNAACDGDEKLCKLLLSAGANVNAFTNDGLVFYGETPLQGAVWYGKSKTCELLLQHGADINATRNHRTPLYIASGCKKIATLAVLLTYKDQLDTCYEVGRTPLHAAVKSIEYENCKLLLKHADSLNITKEDVRDALETLSLKKERVEKVGELKQLFLIENELLEFLNI